MKKCILMISVMLIVIASSAIAVDVTSIQVGLIDYYRFEGAGNWDQAGGDNHGTLVGGIGTAAPKLGYGGLEVNNNGTSEYMSLANSGALDGDWTVGAWVKFANISTGALVSGGTMGIRASQYNDMVSPGLSNVEAEINTNGAWDGNDSSTTLATMLVDTWQYTIYVARDTDADTITDEVELYIDGVSYGKLVFDEFFGSSGGHVEGDPLFEFTLKWDYVGWLSTYGDYDSVEYDADDVAIWGRALATDEIDYLYNSGAGNPAPEPATMLLLGLGGLFLRKKR